MITNLPNSKVFVIDDIIEDNEAHDVTLIEEAIEDIGDVEEIAGQSPVIRLVNYIMYNAVKEGASDIHIEPAEKCVRVRYRIDGCLYKSLEVPLHLLAAVTSRIKIMGSMDISERRLPQDGRIHVMLDGRKIDLRVSTFPTHRGEKTVIRVLDTRSVSLNLEDLGFAEDILVAISRRHPGAQRHRAGHRADRQRQIDHAVRRAERHQLDGKQRLHGGRPDRISPAADQSVPGAGTDGHDVFQGAADAAAARPRRDHGRRGPRRRNGPHGDSGGADRPPGVQHAAHQRRLLVDHAAGEHGGRNVSDRGGAEHGVGAAAGAADLPQVPPGIRAAAKHPQGDGADGLGTGAFFKGVGCRHCRNTGFSGRIGIHELLILDDEIRDAIVSDSPLATIRELAVRKGMITLGFDGFRKMREGITTIEEVLQVTGDCRDFSMAAERILGAIA